MPKTKKKIKDDDEKEEDETTPLWMDKDNDRIIQQKQQKDKDSSDASSPLFGTGSLPLHGEAETSDSEVEEDDEDEDDEEKALVAASPAVSRTSKASKASKTSKSSSKRQKYSSKSSKASTSTNNSKKKKKKAPPKNKIFFKSVFDEQPEDDASSISSGTARALELKPHMPSRNYCLDCFWFIAAISIVASLGLFATQILPLFISPFQEHSFFDIALKVYISLFCILFIIVESDAPIPFIKASQLLQLYFSRGFLYSFLALSKYNFKAVYPVMNDRLFLVFVILLCLICWLTPKNTILHTYCPSISSIQ